MPTDMSRLSKVQLETIYREIPLSLGRRIVLLDVGGRRDIPAIEHNRNVYCIGKDADVIWQIQAVEPTVERDSFVSLTKDEAGTICADRFFGNEFVLDPETGVANHVGWHK